MDRRIDFLHRQYIAVFDNGNRLLMSKIWIDVPVRHDIQKDHCQGLTFDHVVMGEDSIKELKQSKVPYKGEPKKCTAKGLPCFVYSNRGCNLDKESSPPLAYALCFDPRLRRSNMLGNALGVGDDTRLCRCIQTRGKPHVVALMSRHPNRSKVSVLQARNCPKNQLPDPPNRIRNPRTIAPLERRIAMVTVYEECLDGSMGPEIVQTLK
ncbi:uncharacterized protein EI90DRAFT_3285637 [Cantharellus anzutake]|uniref:uncharacterized protein n=1 Tax=Cantharellus anzutake TaxID=1750568 RepID=UPI0019085348|nr:uncharacterized protein EI90DRAFT_3285637 [Cantharellus anzutake]KAF8341544.1 hypothetical protein EI90DRAFT_3285637 [Cantharellus anzutake]